MYEYERVVKILEKAQSHSYIYPIMLLAIALVVIAV